MQVAAQVGRWSFYRRLTTSDLILTPSTFVWRSHDMGAVENSSAEMPAAHEFGSWRRVPTHFFLWECSITSPTSRSDEILGLARACLRPGGRFIFYEPCFSANDDWVGRIFMRLDRGGNIKTDQAWRALLSEYFATVEEYIRRPVYLFRYTIQALIARDPRAES